MNAEDAQWDVMFDIQYKLCRDVADLVKRQLEGLPASWRSIAVMYVLEDLAEMARFDVVLPPLAELSDDEMVLPVVSRTETQ
jgi:hypothetical protein